jgi:hypothetical protein
MEGGQGPQPLGCMEGPITISTMTFSITALNTMK